MQFVYLSIVTLVLSSVSLMGLARVAENIGLIDRPDSRKVHDGHVPLVGGIAVFVSIVIASSFAVGLTNETLCLLVSFLLMVLVGAVDDRNNLKVRPRILAQLISASVLVYGANVQITTLGNVFAVGDISLGLFSGVFTILAIMTSMNAFNMIDGIDGLLGSSAFTAFFGLGCLAFMAGNDTVLLFSLLLLSALIPFLLFNLKILKNKQVFMGDAGSMLIGMMVIWLMVLLINPSLSSSYQFEFNEITSNREAIRPVAMLWLITIPLMDMFGIIVRRILKKQSPLMPDRDHLHHIFMRAGFSSREALLIITMSAFFWLFVGLFLEYLQVSEWIVTLIYIGVFVVYVICLKKSWSLVKLYKKALKVERQ